MVKSPLGEQSRCESPWDIKKECSHRAAPGDKIGPEHSTKQDRLLTWMQKPKEKRNGESQLQGGMGLCISNVQL